MNREKLMNKSRAHMIQFGKSHSAKTNERVGQLCVDYRAYLGRKRECVDAAACGERVSADDKRTACVCLFKV